MRLYVLLERSAFCKRREWSEADWSGSGFHLHLHAVFSGQPRGLFVTRAAAIYQEHEMRLEQIGTSINIYRSGVSCTSIQSYGERILKTPVHSAERNDGPSRVVLLVNSY
jgi:hypothetical protein